MNVHEIRPSRTSAPSDEPPPSQKLGKKRRRAKVVALPFAAPSEIDDAAHRGRRAIESLYFGAEFINLEGVCSDEGTKKLGSLRDEMVNALAALRELEELARKVG